ncbi:MAG: hypothetical protein LAN62_02120 [Acidobacteriia bacterium]|nr:hypothetical protein [Terriglobia bacterium]
MPKHLTRDELLDRIEELEDENDGLREKLDSISDIASEEEEEGEDAGEEVYEESE